MDQVKFETTQVTNDKENSHPTDTPSEAQKPGVKPPESQPTTMKRNTKKSGISTMVIALVMVIAGIVSGYGIYAATASNTSSSSTSSTAGATPSAGQDVVAGQVYGAENGEVFTDEAEGVLVAGGVQGEGSHHLLREGGPSKNVYLTSSVLDLDLFEGHLVKVWGETFQAQQAGWLMDAGKVEVIELNAEPPFEENVDE